MRKISQNYLAELKTGYLAPLTDRVRRDPDLDLFIRDGYINIYFKGNSLLKLTEKKRGGYSAHIHKKYLHGLELQQISDRDDVEKFLGMIPNLKENILYHAKSSLEIEYEQLFIRANNNERENSTDYYFVDRQYTLKGKYRIDLMGIYWPLPHRSEDMVYPCLLEIKYALNADIRKVNQQLMAYYQLLSENPEEIAQDLRTALFQRLELGLFDQPKSRLKALKTLQISPRLEDYQLILAFVDYNPRSSLLDLSAIKVLPFADQIKILHGGFGVWADNLMDLSLDQ